MNLESTRLGLMNNASEKYQVSIRKVQIKGKADSLEDPQTLQKLLLEFVLKVHCVYKF
jgi:hypothetical protein